MQYKNNLKEDNCIIYYKDTRCINKKPEDLVTLRYDEEHQIFYASIKNPSQHTRYLYEQGKLGIALCKLNTGRSQRKKMLAKRISGGNRIPKNFIKIHYHPRWSRCGRNLALVTNLDEEVAIAITTSGQVGRCLSGVGILDLKPNQKRTVLGKWKNWYNSIKAVLVSCNTDNVLRLNETISRSYKTMCKRIKIEYNSDENTIIHRLDHKHKPHVNHYYEYYHVNADIERVSHRTYDISIEELGTKALEAYNKNLLWIGLEFNDLSSYTSRGGKMRKLHYGNKDIATTSSELAIAKRNRRYTARASKLLICPLSNREVISNLEFTYTIPNQVSHGSSSISSLLSLARKHISKGYGEDCYIEKKVTLVIGMNETRSSGGGLQGSSGRILFRYPTNDYVSWFIES